MERFYCDTRNYDTEAACGREGEGEGEEKGRAMESGSVCFKILRCRTWTRKGMQFEAIIAESSVVSAVYICQFLEGWQGEGEA